MRLAPLPPNQATALVSPTLLLGMAVLAVLVDLASATWAWAAPTALTMLCSATRAWDSTPTEAMVSLVEWLTLIMPLNSF